MAQPIFDGPVPPAGKKFCGLCSMIWKGYVLNHPDMIPEIQEVLREPVPRKLRVSGLREVTGYMPEPELQIAVAMGMVMAPLPQGNGIPAGQMAPVLMDLCWTHIQGVMVKEGGLVQPASAADMPGAQVPLLGQQRRR